ncbi:MAG TPA: SMC-Scp complex subunit ScpB [Hyphomicrobiaceae bacterium]|nr:SMC-Scp complex subunit ScpB [Hyphomicrobiaceae bacterium]
MLEALLFAAPEPVDERTLAAQLKSVEDLTPLLEELKGFYAGRGVNLVRVAGKWSFRTAEDLAFLLERHAKEERRLSKAALETLAIVAYHQPVTRAEIEEIRGVSTSKGSLDVLMEAGWVRPRGRRRAPGRPVTYGTTEAFLSHFGLDSIKDLPGLDELKGAGLLDATLPPDFKVPEPHDAATLAADELPLEDGPEGEEAGYAEEWAEGPDGESQERGR